MGLSRVRNPIFSIISILVEPGFKPITSRVPGRHCPSILCNHFTQILPRLRHQGFSNLFSFLSLQLLRHLFFAFSKLVRRFHLLRRLQALLRHPDCRHPRRFHLHRRHHRHYHYHHYHQMMKGCHH